MRGKNIRRYTNKDYRMICTWYIDRDMTPPPPEALSDVGYIVEERVAGWLYLTNSNIAMIEGIISDPASVPSFRRLATKRLIGTLVDLSISLGYTNILGITSHPSMIETIEPFGFKELDKRVFLLSETNEEAELITHDDDKLDNN